MYCVREVVVSVFVSLVTGSVLLTDTALIVLVECLLYSNFIDDCLCS